MLALWLFDLDSSIENESFPVYYKSHYIKFRNKFYQTKRKGEKHFINIHSNSSKLPNFFDNYKTIRVQGDSNTSYHHKHSGDL